MLSIHCPHYVFTDLVSLFISKTHKCHPSAIKVYTRVYIIRVLDSMLPLACMDIALWCQDEKLAMGLV